MATPRPAATPPCDSDPPCTETVEALWGMGTGPEDPDVVVGAEGSYATDMGHADGDRHRDRRYLTFDPRLLPVGLMLQTLRLQGQADPKEVLPVRREEVL